MTADNRETIAIVEWTSTFSDNRFGGCPVGIDDGQFYAWVAAILDRVRA
jgi:hypothetical protein